MANQIKKDEVLFELRTLLTTKIPPRDKLAVVDKIKEVEGWADADQLATLAEALDKRFDALPEEIVAALAGRTDS